MNSSQEIGRVEVPFKDERWDFPIQKGFLLKYTVVLKKIVWRKRFFILTKDGLLWYFKNDKKKEPCKEAVCVKDMKFWKSNRRRFCLEIQRLGSKPFIIQATSLLDYEKLRQTLMISGGILDFHYFDPFIPRFCSKTCDQWNEEDVKDWLNFMIFPDLRSFSIYELQFTKTNGSQLLSMKDEEYSDRWETQDHFSFFQLSIQNLDHQKRMNYHLFNVIRKLLYLSSEKQGQVKILKIFDFARSLSFLSDLKTSYLSNEYVDIASDDPFENISEEELNNDFQIFSQRDLLRPDSDSSPIEEEEEKERITRDQGLEKKYKFPLRICLTECLDIDKFKTVHNYLHNILKEVPKFENEEFGRIKIGIIVGPWFLQWNKHHLIIPKLLKGDLLKLITSHFDAVDFMEEMTFNDLQNVVAEFVIKYNTSMNYPRLWEDREGLRDRPGQANTFQFLLDGFQMLSKNGTSSFLMERVSGGSDILVCDHYKRLEQPEGFLKIEFNPRTEFRKKFKLRDGIFFFETHIELDKFILQLNEIDEIGFFLDYRFEVSQLRVFDMMFWWRYFINPEEEEEKYKPLIHLKEENEEEKMKRSYMFYERHIVKCSCPFDDPRRIK